MRIYVYCVALCVFCSVSIPAHAELAPWAIEFLNATRASTTASSSSAVAPIITIPATTTVPVVSKPVPKKATNIYKDIKLKIPHFMQPYANSCEATSLKMALAFKGVIKDEIDILAKFVYRPTVKDWDNNIWDDPQKQFVGYVDVSGKPNGGYGVYGLPVLRAVEGFGRTGVYATGTDITASFLAQEIDNNNPVLIWGYTSLKEPVYTWTTREGVVVTAVRGEHVRVVTGFKGTVDKPIGFYVHDSFYGRKDEYWTADALIAHIQKIPGVTDQAVAVR